MKSSIALTQVRSGFVGRTSACADYVQRAVATELCPGLGRCYLDRAVTAHAKAYMLFPCQSKGHELPYTMRRER